MSLFPGSLAIILPLLIRILRGPGKVIAAASGIFCLILAWVSFQHRENPFGMICLGLALVLLCAIATFAYRIHILGKHVDDLARLSNSMDIDSYEPSPDPAEDFKQRLSDARVEASQLRHTFMPRVEAAQRAAIAAAGGVVKAPYLQPDLRITLCAGLLTAVSGPVSFILLIVFAAIN